MKESLAERHHLATFVLLAVTGVVLTTVGVKSPERLRPLERAGMAVTSPLAASGARVTRAARDALTGLLAMRTAQDELAGARREIRDLRASLGERAELAAENARLGELLELREKLGARSVPARVVQQALAPDRVLLIDRGSSSGLAPDQAVVAPGGVVGKVLSVTASAAKVQCITDPDAGLAVLVGHERRQVNAIVRDASGGLIRLRHFPLRAELAVGEPVVTSGLDQIYPRGLRVGLIEEVRELGGAEKEVVVRPAVELDRIEEVLVLVPAAAPAGRGAVRP